MPKQIKAQFAIEFMVLIAFMFLIFLGFTAVITIKIIDIKDAERQQIAEDIATLAKNEIELAKTVSDGYIRRFNLPTKIKGNTYTIEIIDNLELVVNYLDKEYVTFLPGNISGNIGKGMNLIKKRNGNISIKNVVECNDEIDNDGDGDIDYPGDVGCTGYLDNDETNCGDGVCEGGENFVTCGADCGGSLLLMKSSLSDVISFYEDGTVVLSGTLFERTTPMPVAGQDEFIFRNNTGANVAIINFVTGNMFIQGDLFESQSTLNNPPSNDFIVKNSVGDIVSYIDDTGNFYLTGTLNP